MTHPGTADARTPTRNPCAPQEVNRTMNKLFSFQLSKLIYSIAAALLLTSESASATADGPDFYQVTGVANGDVLNIRSHPNPHAEKLGEIPPDGTCLRNLGCQGGLTFQEFTELSKARQAARLKENPRWCRIEYQGVTGWVAGRYLQEGTCDSMATGRAPDLREPRSDSFQTVCGVIIDGKTHSYLCTVTEIKGNKGIERTALRFPDQEIQLVWGKGKQVDVLFEGLASATPATYSTDEGETDLFIEDKTYFYYSDRGMAAKAVEHFKP